jgi:hypothetical protein
MSTCALVDMLDMEGALLASAQSSSDRGLPVTNEPGGRWRAWLVAAAVAIAAFAAATGVFVGRATKAVEEAGPAASWQALPAASIVGRLGPSAVWTGTEMIVWGGYARSEDVGQKSDGAAYNPTTGAWRTIASSPPSVRGGAAVVWTGDEIIVWASNSPDGHVGTAAYEPSTDAGAVCPPARSASVKASRRSGQATS